VVGDALVAQLLTGTQERRLVRPERAAHRDRPTVAVPWFAREVQVVLEPDEGGQDVRERPAPRLVDREVPTQRHDVVGGRAAPDDPPGEQGDARGVRVAPVVAGAGGVGGVEDLARLGGGLRSEVGARLDEDDPAFGFF
jgi:hypothetical protein